MTRVALAVLTVPLFVGVCPAAVVSFLNATEQGVEFTVEHANAKPVAVTLAAGEIRAVLVGREPVLRMTLNGQPAAYTLDPYTPYLFTQPKDKPVQFSGVELAADLPKPDDVPAVPTARPPVKVPVALFADDAQPLMKDAWEKAAGARLAAASRVLEQQAGVTFTVAETGEWAALKDAADWPAARADFALKATPKRGARAVGFTTRVVPGEGFGAVIEPGSNHLIVRDGAPKSEGERVEVLVHHLGLWLGAVRSPDRGSVMRAKLGDGRAALVNHRVQFDPLNLLIVNIWADELAAGREPKFGDLRPKARDRLTVLYRTLADIHSEVKSDDTVPRDYVERLQQLRDTDGNREPEKKGADPTPQPPPRIGEGEKDQTPATRQGEKEAKEDPVRTVVQAVTAKAKALATAADKPKGDALTATYIQTAAEAAGKLDEKARGRAFLIGLGIALDDSTILRNKPVVKAVCEAAESDAERKERIAALGLPTVRGRRDLCQHFVVSVALTELFGAAAAEFAGLSKELSDMKGESGFSFADLAADLAGIEFAKVLAKDPARIPALAKGFAVNDYVPDIKPFKEGLNAERFKKDYGTSDDARFQKATDEVRTAIQDLPAYKK